jgi:hypothetical protein
LAHKWQGWPDSGAELIFPQQWTLYATSIIWVVWWGGGWGPSFLQSSDFRSLLFFWFVIYCLLDGNRVIRKVRKTQHQKNPEFDHTQDEIIKKNRRKSTLAFNGG